MAIVGSVITNQAAQRDGRIWVTEVHTDQVGVVYQVVYLALNASGLAAHLAASATNLAAQIVADEIAANINGVQTLGSLASPIFVYSTVTANVAALRAAYLGATQTQAIFIGDYLNMLTSAQLQTAFGMTAQQVTTLRANKLQPAATQATSIRAATGA